MNTQDAYENKYNVGDWIAFYSGGLIVISEIRYLKQGVLGHWIYSTNNGPVREAYILEARSEHSRD